MTRLRRSDCSGPGISRRRRGRGFEYRDDEGRPDHRAARTSRGSASSGSRPRGSDVWICPYPRGHLQATGIDAAGRKQYLYHDAWRARRDAEKFDDMVRFAHALPALREHVAADLDGDELDRASACSPARSGCSTAASSASAPRSTRCRTSPTGWRRCARST